MIGEPLIQILNGDELIYIIHKNLKFLMDNFSKLKKNVIEEEIIEINNLFFEYGRKNSINNY